MEIILMLFGPTIYIIAQLFIILDSKETMRISGMVFSIILSIFIQFLFLSLLGFLFMDYRHFSQLAILTGCLTHWPIVFYLAIKRRNLLNTEDQIMVRLGFFIFTIIALILYPFVKFFYDLLES